MKFLDKLERKFGRFAIHGLPKYLVLFNAVVFILFFTTRSYLFISKLYLVPSKVLEGEIWRLFTYMFIPDNLTSPIWIIFELYILYLIGTSLEMYWGSFKLNLYYLIGMLATTIFAFATGKTASATYLNLSLFLAFAYINPNMEFLLFFILPVKVKYLAYIQWAFIGYSVIFLDWGYKFSAIASVVGFFIFFGPDIISNLKTGRKSYYNRQKFHGEKIKVEYDTSKPLHKCEVCGITDKDDPNMEFRYCSRCQGLHEYCMNHINNHEHK